MIRVFLEIPQCKQRGRTPSIFFFLVKHVIHEFGRISYQQKTSRKMTEISVHENLYHFLFTQQVCMKNLYGNFKCFVILTLCQTLKFLALITRQVYSVTERQCQFEQGRFITDIVSTSKKNKCCFINSYTPYQKPIFRELCRCFPFMTVEGSSLRRSLIIHTHCRCPR